MANEKNKDLSFEDEQASRTRCEALVYQYLSSERENSITTYDAGTTYRRSAKS